MLNKFLCFSEKDEQKLGILRFLAKIYLLLFFILNLKRIIYFEKRYFFKLPVAKKVLSQKKIVTGGLQLSNPLTRRQVFSSPYEEQ